MTKQPHRDEGGRNTDRRLTFSASIATAVVWCTLAGGAPAAAKLCGDDVEGRDVACECGDTVVSDVVLGDDPVAQGTCSGDGLVIRATSGAPALTVDLAGRTLRGDGRGSGVWVIYGGVGGARVRSSGGAALIEGFRDGVSANGASSLGLLEQVVVKKSARTGVRVHAQGYEVRDVEVQGSGMDGFSLTGLTFRVTDTRAVGNKRYGYFVMGRDATLGGNGTHNSAYSNGGTGFAIAGKRHQLIDCVASWNNKGGVRLSGEAHEVRGCLSEGNLDDGISGEGLRWVLGENRALSNGRHGLWIRGGGLVDLGGNIGSANGILSTDPHHVPIQCKIGAFDCFL